MRWRNKKRRRKKNITYDIEELRANPKKLRTAEHEKGKGTSGKNSTTRKGKGKEQQGTRIGESQAIWNNLEKDLRGETRRGIPKKGAEKKRNG